MVCGRGEERGRLGAEAGGDMILFHIGKEKCERMLRHCGDG